MDSIAIDSATEYAMRLSERPRTLETVESMTTSTTNRIDEITSNSVLTQKESLTALPEKLALLPTKSLFNPLSLDMAKNMLKKRTSFSEQPQVGTMKQESSVSGIQTQKIENKNSPLKNAVKQKKVFEALRHVLQDDSRDQKSLVNNILKIIKTKDARKLAPDGYVNGYERSTWVRLSGQDSKLRKLTAAQKFEQSRLDSRKDKNVEEQSLDSVIMARLMASLSHNHPSEINQTFAEIDRKSRLQRTQISTEEFIKLLSKPGLSRTNTQVQAIDDYLRLLREFQAKPDFIIIHLCRTLYISIFKRGDLIFSQGDQGNKWYVILSGTVKITVAKPGWSFLDPKAPQNYIATLKPGEKFGDHALLNDLNRMASAWADSEPTVLISLDKPDFLRLIAQAHQIEQKPRIMLLKKIPMLSKLDLSGLRNIADRLVLRTIAPNSILQRQGEITDTVFFIKTGTCAVFRVAHIPTETGIKKKTLLLGHLGPADSFNEECAFSGRTTTSRKGAPFTVVTIDTVVIATIASSGEWLNFSLIKTVSPFETLTNEELVYKYKVSLQTKCFRNYQKRYIDSLAIKWGIK